MSQDETDIRALSDRYCDALTRADFAAMRACYADDAVWEHANSGLRFDGADAIMAFNEKIVGGMEVLIQIGGSHIVNIDGDRAILRSIVLETGRSRDGAKGMTQYGLYVSDLRRDPARGWLFVKRVFHTILSDRTPPAGQVFPLPSV